MQHWHLPHMNGALSRIGYGCHQQINRCLSSSVLLNSCGFVAVVERYHWYRTLSVLRLDCSCRALRFDICILKPCTSEHQTTNKTIVSKKAMACKLDVSTTGIQTFADMRSN